MLKSRSLCSSRVGSLRGGLGSTYVVCVGPHNTGTYCCLRHPMFLFQLKDRSRHFLYVSHLACLDCYPKGTYFLLRTKRVDILDVFLEQTSALLANKNLQTAAFDPINYTPEPSRWRSKALVGSSWWSL